MAIAENLLTVQEYAKNKGVDRSKIYTLIKSGKIIPETFLGRQCIDNSKYGALDVEAAIKERGDQVAKLIVSHDKIQKENADLKSRLKKLEKVVYATSENGRGPAKDKN